MADSSNARRILVVDDEPAVRSALVRLLRAEFHVDAADGLDDAVRRLEATCYDVVLSDDRMENGSGRALLAIVRERFPAAHRVLMSGNDVLSERDSDPAWEYFVAKPFGGDTLHALLRRLRSP